MNRRHRRSAARPLRAALALAIALGLAACHEITGIDPNPGRAGTDVVISGTGFGATQAANAQVLHDGTPMPVVSWSNTAIVATLPLDKVTGTHTIDVVLGLESQSAFHTLIQAATP